MTLHYEKRTYEKPTYAGWKKVDPDGALFKLYRDGKWLKDRYELVKFLGKGGYGTTVLAWDHGVHHSKRLCVIKHLRTQKDKHRSVEKVSARFEQEARIQQWVGSHPQIPSLLDAFEWRGDYFLIQEYVRGQVLEDEIRKHGPWSEAMVLQFLFHVLPLVQYLHDLHIIHCDIKPSNWLRMQRTGTLALVDFGSAVEADSLKTVDLSLLSGTLGFAAPEQWQRNPVYASDLYALGATCLFLLTGKLPTDFPWDMETRSIQWQGRVRVHPSFHPVLDKMLQVRVEKRVQSAGELTHLLQNVTLTEVEPVEKYQHPNHRFALQIRERRQRVGATSLVSSLRNP